MFFTKTSRFCCLALIAIGPATVVGDDTVGNDPLEPLNRRVGSWVNKVVEKKAAWNPVERTVAGEEKIQWVLDKNFIQGDLVMKDGAKGRWLINYDAEAKVYRSWFFGNNSFPGGDTIGHWNPKLERMDWEFEVGEDLHGKMRFQFFGQDKMEWKITIHDGRGQLMMETVGVQTRKE
ncbi:MAG: hypothetical protein P8K79_08575 [Mariniblastus sp.]|nr:hypothetical protein [Mariniblastus sp.]